MGRLYGMRLGSIEYVGECTVMMCPVRVGTHMGLGIKLFGHLRLARQCTAWHALDSSTADYQKPLPCP